MPTIDLSDEELQQLTLVLANASGPGISWMMTNGLLTKVQAAAQAHAASQVPAGPDFRPAPQTGNSLDHEPIAQPPVLPGNRGGARR